MKDTNEKSEEGLKFKCPECRAPLKQRRARKTNECELICGGCGAMFDVCDLDTVEALRASEKK